MLNRTITRIFVACTQMYVICHTKPYITYYIVLFFSSKPFLKKFFESGNIKFPNHFFIQRWVRIGCPLQGLPHYLIGLKKIDRQVVSRINLSIPPYKNGEDKRIERTSNRICMSSLLSIRIRIVQKFQIQGNETELFPSVLEKKYKPCYCVLVNRNVIFFCMYSPMLPNERKAEIISSRD